jgi:hypothetical protein
MAVITPPSTLAIGAQRIEQVTYDMTETSDVTGSMSVRIGGLPRWRMTVGMPTPLEPARADVWKALVLQLRGRINHLAMWDGQRPQPRGTMRGTMTLSAGASAGATSVSITAGAGQASRTLLAGDWLQIGTGVGTSVLVMVVSDATANGSGVITATIEPPLRYAFSSGAAVTWDRPVAYYKRISGAAGWDNVPLTGAHGGLSLDLIEQWT